MNIFDPINKTLYWFNMNFWHDFKSLMNLGYLHDSIIFRDISDDMQVNKSFLRYTSPTLDNDSLGVLDQASEPIVMPLVDDSA